MAWWTQFKGISVILIVLNLIIGLIVGVVTKDWRIGGAIIGSAVLSGLISALTGSETGDNPDTSQDFVIAYFTSIFSYLPIVLMGFGFISDTISESYTNSGASLTGIGAILVNWILAKIFGNYDTSYAIPSLDQPLEDTSVFNTIFNHTRQQNYCNLPGLNISTIFPQTLFVTLSILFYYLYQLVDTGKQTSGIGGMIGFVILLESIILANNKCLPPPLEGESGFVYWRVWGPGLLKIILTVGVSAIMGCFYYANRAIVASSSAKKYSGTSTSSIPVNVGPVEEKSQAVDDKDQFVCEAYKDGELITSVIAG
jgi:hypothetical protein